MKKAILIISAILCCGVLCAKKHNTPIATGEYKDWCNYLDYININKVVNIDNYKTIVILPIGQDKVVWPDKDDNQYPALKKALAEAPSIFQKQLEKELKDKNIEVKIANSNATPKNGEILIKLNIESLDMGNRALRVWVGFGAGNQNIEISGYAEDTSGKCFSFKQKHYSIKMTSYEKVLNSEFKNFGEEIADIFINMQK